MYKLLIVDDDGIIRKGLSMNIPWRDNGFDLIGIAGDGETALEIVDEYKPDIVISDIKMPFMDGIQFTKILRAKYPKIKIILLSGYEEFEYAREALKMKVYDYILKPVDRIQLLNTVKGAAWELQNEIKIQNQILESMPLLRQNFLTKLIQKQYEDDEEIIRQINFLGIQLRNGKFITLAIKADDYDNSDFYDNVLDKELLKFSIQNISEETLNEKCNGIVFDSGADEIIVICNDTELSREDMFILGYEIADEIRKRIHSYLKTTVTIGVGISCSELRGISESYTSACTATEYRHILGKNQVISIADVTPKEDFYNLDFSNLRKQLIQKVKLGMEVDSSDILKAIKDKIQGNAFVSLDYIRLVSVEIVILLLKEFDNIIANGESNGANLDVYILSTEIYKLKTIDEIFDKIYSVIIELCRIINSKRYNHQRNVVERAMDYIKNNFYKENLSLQDVASEVYVSPTYLSIIFKQEKDINFSEFILKTRMERAMELIRSTDLKTYEVAEKVGYSNAQYFSVCFKKYTGKSPSSFRHN